MMAKLMTAASAFMNGEYVRRRESHALEIVEKLFLPAATTLDDDGRDYHDPQPLLLPKMVNKHGVVQEVDVDSCMDVASIIRHSTPGAELYFPYVHGLHEGAAEEELEELTVVRIGVREHMRRAVEFFKEHEEEGDEECETSFEGTMNNIREAGYEFQDYISALVPAISASSKAERKKLDPASESERAAGKDAWRAAFAYE